MELNLKNKKLSSLLFQRNFLGGLTVFLLLITLLQTILFFFKEIFMRLLLPLLLLQAISISKLCASQTLALKPGERIKTSISSDSSGIG